MPAVGHSKFGWGVVRPKPWRFVELFPTRKQAENKANDLGSEYKVYYGEHRPGTGEFMYRPTKVRSSRKDDAKGT